MEADVFHHSRYPCEEGLIPFFEKAHIGVHVLMHPRLKLLLQLEWQFIQELREIPVLLLMIVLDGPHQLIKEGQVQLVLLLDLVEYRYLLFKLGLSCIHTLDYGTQRPCRVGERDHAEDHEDHAEKLFEIVEGANVPITDSQNCCDREIYGRDIYVYGGPIREVLHKQPVILALIIVTPDKDPIKMRLDVVSYQMHPAQCYKIKKVRNIISILSMP